MAQFVPWASLTIAALIIVFNVYVFTSTRRPSVWYSFAGNRRALEAGEWWRVVTYSLPHSNIQHFVEDVIYFLIVSSIAERVLGPFFAVVAFYLCCVCGALSFVLWDENFCWLVGSSAGTHGLFVSVVVYFGCKLPGWHFRAFAIATVAYMYYLSIYAIHHGVMGWPLTMLPNGGYDHLGGVSSGLCLGLAYYFCQQLNVGRMPIEPRQRMDNEQ